MVKIKNNNNMLEAQDEQVGNFSFFASTGALLPIAVSRLERVPPRAARKKEASKGGKKGN
jgi:hypothetical protein